jgi:uncharacterized membrane protein
MEIVEIILAVAIFSVWAFGSYEAYRAQIQLMRMLGQKRRFSHWTHYAMVIFSWGGYFAIKEEEKRIFNK